MFASCWAHVVAVNTGKETNMNAYRNFALIATAARHSPYHTERKCTIPIKN